MEEADAIIFPILKDIGCQLPANISSINQIGEHVYSITAACLRVINPESSLEPTLPTTKVNRFRLTTAAAAAVKQLGYPDEIGYQSFLYPNDFEIRKIVTFLVDKIPRNEGNGGDTSNEDFRGLSGRIRQVVQDFTAPKQHYNVFQLGRRAVSPINFVTSSFVPTSSSSLPLLQTYNHHSQQQQYLQKQHPQHIVRPSMRSSVYTEPLPALIATNTYDILATRRQDENTAGFQSNGGAGVGFDSQSFKASLHASFKQSLQSANKQLTEYDNARETARLTTRGNQDLIDSVFTRKTQFTQTTTVAVADNHVNFEQDAKIEEEAYRALLEERTREITTLQLSLEQLLTQSTTLVSNTTTISSAIESAQYKMSQNEILLRDLQRQIQTRQRVFDFLPNATENIAKLQQLTQDNVNKIIQLNTQWENVRLGLITEIQNQHGKQFSQQELYVKNIEHLTQLRHEIKLQSTNIHNAEETYTTALNEYQNLPHDINRNVYIKRIMDIVKNIDKQNDEISAILTDIRNAKREITNKQESVNRSFNEADDLIYAYAREHRSSVAIAIYKDIVGVRDGFDTIVNYVEQVDKKQTAIQDLQQSIDLIEERGTTNNMDAVIEDLTQIKQENNDMKQKLQQFKQQQQQQQPKEAAGVKKSKKGKQ